MSKIGHAAFFALPASGHVNPTLALVEELVKRGERVDYFESLRLTKDGRRLNVSISVSPIYDAEGNIVGASAIGRNITAQKKIEDQLRQSQKMEAVGQLTGGVAHDFNNLLTIIIGNLGIAKRGVVEARAERALNNALIGAERAAQLTQRLLAFSRRQPLNPFFRVPRHRLGVELAEGLPIAFSFPEHE